MAPAPDARQRGIRQAAIVICVTIVAWMGASWIGGQMGLPVRWAFLIDLLALGAFAYALILVYWAWRSGQ